MLKKTSTVATVDFTGYIVFQAKYDARQTKGKETLLPYNHKGALHHSNGYHPQNGISANGYNNNKHFVPKVRPITGNLLFI